MSEGLQKVRRLTAEEIGLVLKLHKEGLTQAAIAQRLDCDQSTVSKWLARLTDTTETAKAFLRGQAFRMARNLVVNGRASDHGKALVGLSVLGDESGGPRVTVQIGASMADVQVAAVQVNIGGAS